MKDLGWRQFGLGKLVLLHYPAHPDLFVRDGNDPKPFVFQPHDDGVARCGAVVQKDALKMAEDSQFFQFRMNDAQTFLIACEIAAPAGVHEEGGGEPVCLAGVASGVNDGFTGEGRELGDRPAFMNFGGASPGVVEQQMVEGGAFDLKGRGFTGEAAVAEDQLEDLAGIAEVKLSAKFPWEASGFERRQDAHLIEQPPVVWQQRFADVKAWKVFFLQQQDTFPGASQKSGGGA